MTAAFAKLSGRNSWADRMQGIPPILAEKFAVFRESDGQMLAEQNGRKRGQVASLQKLLTALIVVEAGDLRALVEVAPEDTQCQMIRTGFIPGRRYARSDLLKCLLIGSGNDAALALARDCSGTVDRFVEAMNDRAMQLGMNDSRFQNPHGLPDERQFSTAFDLLRLARAVDGVPLLRTIVAAPQFAFEPDVEAVVEIHNTNRLLQSFAGCDGMKTGFTRAAGHCLLATADISGQRTVAVVLNSSADRLWSDARQLLAGRSDCDASVREVAHGHG